MNSNENQNSRKPKNSKEAKKKRWEQRQRMNNRRSKLQEKRNNYKNSKFNPKSQNNHIYLEDSSDIQRKFQQQAAIPPLMAVPLISNNPGETGEIILSNSPMRNSLNTSTFSIFDQNLCNASLNKSQERLNSSLQTTNLEKNEDEESQQKNKVTISKLLNEVCNEPGANESNIASKFFQALVTELLSLTDSLPEQRSFIYNILSTLVDLGMRCAHKEVAQESVSQDGNVQVDVSNSSENSYFKDLHSLINVDYRLQSLLKERVDLYGSIYNFMRRVQKDPDNTDDNVVQNSIENIKEEIAANTESFNNLQNNVISLNESNQNSDSTNISPVLTSQNENQEITTEQSSTNQNSFNDDSRNENRKQNSVNAEIINQSFGSIQSTELQCFCIHDQVLIGGYKNGSILIFCLETGTILDNVQPHKKPVTSITMVENLLITTSLDGILKKYDLKNHTVKKINLEHGIYTSCNYKDIIYLGTNSGHVLRVIIKEMKQFSIPFCVSQETVLSIKVTEERNALLMFIVTKGSSVCIRDGIKGSLLYIFQNYQNARNIMLLNDPLRLCAGFDDKLLIQEVTVHPGTSCTMKPHSVTSMLLHNGIILIASKENKIFIYDEKSISELLIISNVPENITGMAVWRDFLIVVSSKGFKYVKIPKLVLASFGK